MGMTLSLSPTVPGPADRTVGKTTPLSDGTSGVDRGLDGGGRRNQMGELSDDDLHRDEIRLESFSDNN